MRTRRRYLLALLVLLLVVASRAFAQQGALELDPSRSAIRFTLKTSLHTVHGTFKLRSGKVSVDPVTGKASGLIVVGALSGESGNRGRDSKMQREILESQTYPEITFAPHDIEGGVEMQGDSHIEVRGTFRLHGQDHDMVIPVVLRIAGSDLTLDADFSIPFIAWGLKNPSTFILRVSDTVQVSLHAGGHWMAGATN